MPSINTFLTYADQAEEAASFYVSIFPDSRIVEITRYGEAGPGPAGSAMAVVFELLGRKYVALNGGDFFKFTEGISLSVECQTQSEIDEYWAKLTDGGEEGRCGWLKDRFGVSWQVNPASIKEIFGGPDAEGSKRAMAAMLQMKKLDFGELERAYAGR